MVEEKKPEGERAHALLSASGASRWINCPPSARLEEKYGKSKESSYAKEGTLAHALGELDLRLKSKKITKKEYSNLVESIKSDPMFNYDMEQEVDKYTTYIMEEYKSACKKVPDSVLLIEEKFDFSHLVEDGFGTGDAVIISDGLLFIGDLKFGKGVRVDADNNSQLMLYGIGALNAFELLYDIHTVRLAIIQPRLDHISTWDISVEDLLKWGEEIVRPKALLAYAGEGGLNCGDWCKWCKIKARCQKIADQNISLAQRDFETEELIEPRLLSDEMLLEIYNQIPLFQEWINSISAYMLSEAIQGKKWDGLKLVEGRSNRKWIDEEPVVDYLKMKGYKPEEYSKTKLKGLSDIEKLVSKGVFNSVLSPYVIKPQGAPTLVDLSDKRPAMGLDQAKLDFME